MVKAMKVTAGLAESNASLLPCLWRDSLYVTSGLTACTLGSAPNPMLGKKYGKTLLFHSVKSKLFILHNSSYRTKTNTQESNAEKSVRSPHKKMQCK